MKVIYMGTPDFAVPALEMLHGAGYEIPYVVTQPDASKGRGKKMKQPPVKEKALELGLEVLQPEKIRGDDAFIEKIAAAEPDLIAVAAYGQILPVEVLEIPPLGCVNIHGSLLPRFRGAAPVQRAIMAGDEETGVTIMYMEKGLDTGDMIAKRSTPTAGKTGEQLHDELSVLGAELLLETVPQLGKIKAEKQDDSLSTYAPMITKKEGRIDFTKTAAEIERMIRAFDPWPGSYTYYDDMMLKFWRAADPGIKTDAKDGTILAAGPEGMDIAAGGTVLRVDVIQKPGKKRVEVREYLKGNAIEIGKILG